MSSFFGDVTDFLTGGENSAAQDAMKRAGERLSGINTPTVDQLTLPELQQYVQAGLMTPAQAQAYLQDHNALSDQKIDQTGNAAMVQALNQLSDVSDAGPMGTPIEQAQVENATDQMNQAVSGQRGAIEQEMEAKGTPAAMLQAVLQNQYVGQDAQQAHRNAMQAQAQAYQQAVNALSEKAGVGSNLQQMQNTQSNTVAAADNAMQQFNARNQQAASASNAGFQQQANAVNTENAQNVADKNTEVKNQRTVHNANLPQTVFQDQMQKATGQVGVDQSQASLDTAQGKQNAGTASSIIGAISNMGGDMAMAPPVGMVAKGGILSHDGCYHEGGICMDDGGMIPGRATVPGDSLTNDKIHVMASPGEAVIPRSSVQSHPQEVLNLIAEARGGARPEPAAHPQDVATLLHALRAIRTGGA